MRAAPGYGVPNRFKVGKKFWRRLPPIGRAVFNTVYETMRDNQEMFVHHKDKLHTPRRWRITCWHAAWIAADAARPPKRKRA